MPTKTLRRQAEDLGLLAPDGSFPVEALPVLEKHAADTSDQFLASQVRFAKAAAGVPANAGLMQAAG